MDVALEAETPLGKAPAGKRRQLSLQAILDEDETSHSEGTKRRCGFTRRGHFRG